MIPEEDSKLINEYRKTYKGFDISFQQSNAVDEIRLVAIKDGAVKFEIWIPIEKSYIEKESNILQLQSGKAWELIGVMFEFIDKALMQKINKRFIQSMAKRKIKFAIS